MTRIYLDNAATSWPKPQGVAQAMIDYVQQLGAPQGRSSYANAIDVDRVVSRCRSKVAQLLGAKEDHQCIFTFNCTDALNLVIQGILKPGDRVITTPLEHNSVIRPLYHLKELIGIEVCEVPLDEKLQVDLKILKAELIQETRLVIVSHASNVTGTIQPIDQIVPIAHQAGSKVLVDAAQTAGHIPINFTESKIDFLATSGHKGLLGPLGTGILLVKDSLSDELNPLRFGGTGTQSELTSQPEELPDRYESGSPNLPGIFGLHAALEFIEAESIEKIQKRIRYLTQLFLAQLIEIPSVSCIGDCDMENNIGVISCQFDSFQPQEVAAILDSTFGVEVRAGYHCSPNMHKWLNSFEAGGSVRFSIGYFNTDDEIQMAIAAIKELVGF